MKTMKDCCFMLIYVSLYSVLIDFCLEFLTSSKGRIEELMKENEENDNPNKFREDVLKTLKSMKIRIYCFIAGMVVLQFFYWYYLTCFCNCDPGSNNDWLASGFICLGIIQTLGFLSVFLASSFRFIGLKMNSEVFYDLSICLTSD